MRKPKAALPIYDSTIFIAKRDVFSMFGKVVGFFPRFASSNFPASMSFGKCSTKPVIAAGMNSIGTEGFLATVPLPVECRFSETCPE